jgi:hypothetical protein
MVFSVAEEFDFQVSDGRKRTRVERDSRIFGERGIQPKRIVFQVGPVDHAVFNRPLARTTLSAPSAPVFANFIAIEVVGKHNLPLRVEWAGVADVACLTGSRECGEQAYYE